MRRGHEEHDAVGSRVDVDALNPRWTSEAHGRPQQRRPREVVVRRAPYAGASTPGVRRTVHEALGGFDEGFRACEDVDYCSSAPASGTAS